MLLSEHQPLRATPGHPGDAVAAEPEPMFVGALAAAGAPNSPEGVDCQLQSV